MSNHCLICFQNLRREENWSTFFLPKREKICYKCREKLTYITEIQCQKCGRESEETLCFDCIRWGKIYRGNDVLDRNQSLFAYNESMQEIIFSWKYRLDYHIVEAFRDEWKGKFQSFIHEVVKEDIRDVVVAPIPLSQSRLIERGFNQAEQLAHMVDANVVELFRRVETEKQAKKSRMERLQSKNPFTLIKETKQTVILIDDIYTTGRTVRHAASICKLNGCKQVYSFTLCRG